VKLNHSIIHDKHWMVKLPIQRKIVRGLVAGSYVGQEVGPHLVDIQNWLTDHKGFGHWYCISYLVENVFIFSDERDALFFTLRFGGEVQ